MNYLFLNRLKETIKLYKPAIKTLVWGAICLVVGIMMWYDNTVSYKVNVFDELSLINNANISQGVLIETFEEEIEGPDYEGNKVYLVENGIYKFLASNGKEYKALKRNPEGDFEQSLDIEYLKENPEINRIKGDGCTSVFEWIWRKVGLLALFGAIGVNFLIIGLKEFKKISTPFSAKIQ